MKPYQFFAVRKFPEHLKAGESIAKQIQLTLSGEGEDVQTSIKMENPTFQGSLGLFRIESQIKHKTYGIIKKVIEEKRQRIEFHEYLEPVDFPAFYDAANQVVIFQAPKAVCRGVLSNLRRMSDQIELTEMTVDFAKVLALRGEYLGAWFRSVSSRVHAAGLSGNQLQDDALFTKLLSDGELSNVTIPWLFQDMEHRIMITGTGAIVLVQDFKTNQGFELKLVMDVFQSLLVNVWEEKKGRRSACGPI